MSYKKSPTRLYKNSKDGSFMGVCAGIADYLDVRVGIVRLVTVLGAIFTGFWLFVIGYIALGMFLPNKPEDLYEDSEDEEFWRQTRKAPEYTAAELRKRFRDIERRTSDMEAYVTSKRFKLERELRSLE